MLKIELTTNKSLLAFRATIRQACEDMGLRLGKDHSKTDYIASKLLNTKNMNEAMSKVSKDTLQPVTLSDADMESLNNIHLEESVFHVDMLSCKKPRTLLYGYHCSLENGSSPTFHVYLDNDGLIHALTYDCDEQIIKHIKAESITAKELSPNKRAYPSATDKEFAFLLNELLDYNVSYTSFCKNRQPAQYHGKTIDQLNPVPRIYVDARELSCAFSEHVREYCEEVINQEKFDNFYAMYHREEVNKVVDPITKPVRMIGFSFAKNKALTQEEINAFTLALTHDTVIEAMSETNFIKRQQFNEVFTELLGIKIRL